MNISFNITDLMDGRVTDPFEMPCLCMNCPECRGYVIDTRRPVDPDSRRCDWKPNKQDLIEQAEAMLVEANEGRPAVLTKDKPNLGGRPRRQGRHHETKQTD